MTYLQLWLQDTDDFDGALFLIEEVGHRSNGVAQDLFRLVPPQGLAGSCAAAGGTIWLESDSEEARGVVAAPDFVQAEGLRTLVATCLRGEHRGVALAGSHEQYVVHKTDSSEEFRLIATVALDRLAQLNLANGFEAAKFVAGAYSHLTDEPRVLSGALAKMAKVFQFDAAVVLRSGVRFEALVPVCSLPSERLGSTRARTALIDSIMSTREPLRV